MRLTLLAAGLAIAVSGGAALAATAHWAPAMPKFRVEVRDAANAQPTSLLLIYGDDGSSPFRDGPLARDQHISNCHANGAACVAQAGKVALRSGLRRRQSLQLRSFNGSGNPIIGAVSWNGPAYPRELRVFCDLRIGNVAKSCHIASLVV